MTPLTPRERLLATLQDGRTDRPSLLGGWVLGDAQHQALAGCTPEEYWRDPARWAIEAHRRLGVDAMIALHVPREPGDYRDGLTHEAFEAYKERYPTVEHVLAYAQAQPAPAEAAAEFDAEGWGAGFRQHVLAMQAQMGDLVYLPTLWEVVHPRFEWYPEFGYENYLLFMHLYREEAYRFFASLAAVTRRKAEMAVQVYRELDLVPVTLIGTDICGGGGPIASPRLLDEVYFPHVRYSLEPLVVAGIRTVWHSDGDFRPIIPHLLACGVDGFQGFQEEFGVDIAALAQLRTHAGKPPVLWAGPSVTTTLPFGSVADVERDVERIIDTLADTCPLFILPANNILPDCPVENIAAMYGHAAQYGAARAEAARPSRRADGGSS
jgi:hypothetical protein